ncbi:anapc11 [Ecytonucleospora hepatopenaei]|uniref:Anapc11 n=1 Tax=Ecytonucleospora hepatopenaei TaxID=646526 RepID=A0A1W0E530_9MICR|nr:anapc11 [Ecytonucleospora hepatopenaei]
MDKKIIKINKVFPRYTWKWKLDCECCLICQQEFNATCNECNHPITCVPVTGTCTHTFHKHCLTEWMEKNKNCPVCRKEFEILKTYKVPNKFI